MTEKKKPHGNTGKPGQVGNQHAKGKNLGNKFAQGCETSGRPAYYTEEWCDKEAEALREFIQKDDGYYIGTFAKRRGYHRRRITEFVKKSEKFARAYEEAQMWQEEKFVVKALTREWDASFVSKCMARVCGDEWKSSYDATSDTSLKELATAVMNYATAQPQGDGWQKPKEKPKKK